MRRVVATLLLPALLIGGLLGCETPLNTEDAPVADVLGASHGAANALIDQAGPRLNPSKPLITATFVKIDDLEQTSSFGRIIAQQVASRFAERGYKVVEMLLRNNVYIKQGGGEFLLSREVRNISSEHNAQAVIVGTYAVGRKNVLVTAKLIQATDGIVLSSYDYSLPIDTDVAFLLRGG